MSNPGSKAAMRGFVFFFAWFGGGLIVLYGFSGFLSTKPAVATIVNQFGGYFPFLDFFWWTLTVPILIYWYIIRGVPRRRRPFHN